MKTANLRISLFSLALILWTPEPGAGSWTIALDADARAWSRGRGTEEAELHILGLLARRTFTDAKGDRLTVSCLVESEHNFDETFLHEGYLRYKGPLGKWNVTAGRYRLPYGLRYGFDPSRYLYPVHSDQTIGYHVDNGALLSGIVGRLDYAASVTQGLGPHHAPALAAHGFFAGRLGVALGETDEAGIGFSFAAGRSASHHNPDHIISREIAAADGTFYLWQFLLRGEANAGKVNGVSTIGILVISDYALLPRIDLTATGGALRTGDYNEYKLFLGFTARPPWLTIRGGYTYEDIGSAQHKIALQAYRLFSLSR